MTDFLKIAKSIVVHFAHICAYGVETVKKYTQFIVRKFCVYAQLNLTLVELSCCTLKGIN